MNEENNKKVNNDDKQISIEESFDELLKTVYDDARVYSEGKPTREDVMREKDEQRRESEMNAIKEDIERRYTQDFEAAKSSADTAVEEAKDESNGKVRLNEMLDLDAFKESEKRKKKSGGKKKKKEKQPTYIDLDEKSAVYSFIYLMGDVVLRLLDNIVGTIVRLLSIPLRRLVEELRYSTGNFKGRLDSRARGFLKEIIYFRREVKTAGRSILKGFRHPMSVPGIIGHYIGKAFNRHLHLLITLFNTALPIASAVLMIAVFNYWHNVTFALDVIYNNESIGYISDETVFTEARELVIDRLSENNSENTTNSENLDAGYRLALVSLDELQDAKTIADKMIQFSGDKLTHACGIYIDNKFVCAVKNEADAKTVFYEILDVYQSENTEKNCSIGFAEDIDYVQGLYRDDATVMWDAGKLKNTVLGESGASASYTVRTIDTMASIAEAFSTTVNNLRKLNPNLSDEDYVPGKLISVPSDNKMISIKKTYTTTKVRDVAYQTITSRDATKYSGYRNVTQKGVNGREKVITTRTTINGIEVGIDKRYETLTPPVDEIVTIGSRTTYGGVYIGEASLMGFLWPAPSCHYVSSPYGWRSTGWHKGIDLCTGNGTAAGTPVIASRAGRVEIVQRSLSGYGHMVLINHGDGYKTRYAHLIAGSICVSPGDYVEAGQTIGKVGSTGNSSGPHLHFEVIYNGETQDPKKFIS